MVDGTNIKYVIGRKRTAELDDVDDDGDDDVDVEVLEDEEDKLMIVMKTWTCPANFS